MPVSEESEAKHNVPELRNLTVKKQIKLKKHYLLN